MTTFFLPGLDAANGEAEAAYASIRETVAVGTGHVSRERRIWRLSSRRGGRDCVTEVGLPDPITGELVIAILDLGTHMPFAVYTRDLDGGGSIQELKIQQVYEVFEFAA
jgi:hypothetical protein